MRKTEKFATSAIWLWELIRIARNVSRDGKEIYLTLTLIPQIKINRLYRVLNRCAKCVIVKTLLSTDVSKLMVQLPTIAAAVMKSVISEHVFNTC